MNINAHSSGPQFDHNPLIAAMRCFCLAKLGEEAEVPKELCE